MWVLLRMRDFIRNYDLSPFPEREKNCSLRGEKSSKREILVKSFSGLIMTFFSPDFKNHPRTFGASRTPG